MPCLQVLCQREQVGKIGLVTLSKFITSRSLILCCCSPCTSAQWIGNSFTNVDIATTFPIGHLAELMQSTALIAGRPFLPLFPRRFLPGKGSATKPGCGAPETYPGIPGGDLQYGLELRTILQNFILLLFDTEYYFITNFLT